MRPVCMGVDYDADHPDRDGNKMSEDCLFVNIWAPTDATSRSNLPVMVFVQGGGQISESFCIQGCGQLKLMPCRIYAKRQR